MYCAERGHVERSGNNVFQTKTKKKYFSRGPYDAVLSSHSSRLPQGLSSLKSFLIVEIYYCLVLIEENKKVYTRINLPPKKIKRTSFRRRFRFSLLCIKPFARCNRLWACPIAPWFANWAIQRSFWGRFRCSLTAATE